MKPNDSYSLYRELVECLKIEVLRGNHKPFTWRRAAWRAFRCYDRRFYFIFRLGQYFYRTNKFNLSRIAKERLNKLNAQYNVDIDPDVVIGAGLHISHFPGIVIRPDCIIGKNLLIRQNTTLGRKQNEDGMMIIGDNVNIGANCCILGNINIGDNVTIGAMTFVNKDLPANAVVYSAKELIFIEAAKDNIQENDAR
ncbi:serine acetyltransferase [Kosakonia sacchari]|uniref:serine acetyltransferase n=1 Tax=Kosakonia sacchari TaxID=1158459 RepID=UPI000BE59630|nr:serine acetyltransferase [Kosakonia sacchari]PDO89964.1 serine acetyltransferase [Kosakonia sacchari]